MNDTKIGCVCVPYPYEKLLEMIREGMDMDDLQELGITRGCGACYPYILEIFKKVEGEIK